VHVGAKLAVLAAAAGLSLAACSDAPQPPAPDAAARGERGGTPAVRSTDRRPRGGTALAALGALPVKGRAPKTGYDREQFGGDWASVDGCDMRERVLRRDLRRLIYEAGSDCEVSSGILDDRYTAQTVIFHRGGASEVDIDHVVALGDAWQKGAQRWSERRRERFANDPLNLLASEASANRAKGDSDAASWLPPNKRFRCDYVARQIAVKRRYRAWVTAAERDQIARVLARCPDTRLPLRTAGSRRRTPRTPSHR
jgi:Protein of unknown function (DUF1524)